MHPDQIQNGNCQSIGHMVLDNSRGAGDAEARNVSEKGSGHNPQTAASSVVAVTSGKGKEVDQPAAN
jgi:hypothetical protein